MRGYAENIRPNFPESALLAEVSPACWGALNRAWAVGEYQSGQTIISADDTSDDICFLLRGTARATLFTDGGREVAFVDLERGDVFGEFSAIDQAPRSASVMATDTCTAARLPADRFRDLLTQHGDLAMALLRALVGKLRDLTKRVSDFNAFSADERIRHALLRLAMKEARGGDSARIERPPTQAALAALVFSNRETVAREMGRMKAMGLLARDGRKLVIPSVAKLKAYAEPD